MSGGADSVALLSLLRDRPDLSLHVVHLNHQTRGKASDDDAEFVRQLADRLALPHTLAIRSGVEPTLGNLPRNPSARYRAARMGLFRRVVHTHGLNGVILAHHADDLAETVLQRLLRGSTALGLVGPETRTDLDGLVLLRPLLSVRRDTLRAVLLARLLEWREDQSNASNAYFRNRVRRMLAGRPVLTAALIALHEACRRWRAWLSANAPAPGEQLPGALLRGLAPVLAQQTGRQWLHARGVPHDELRRDVVQRLLTMASDAASPAQQSFPGNILVRRRAGRLWVGQ